MDGNRIGPDQNVVRTSLAQRGALTLVGMLSCALALVYGIGSRDDPYITFWVAEQFAKSGRIVNINGAPLEQSSSLAHVVALAVLYDMTHAPMPVLGYALGLVGLFATVLLSASLAGRVRAGTQLLAACVVGLAFPILYWAGGELETDLASAAVLWFILSLHGLLTSPQLRRRTVAGFAASSVFVVTVRPDTMVVALLLCLVVVAVSLLPSVNLGRVAGLAPALNPRRAGLAFGGVAGIAGMLTIYRRLAFHRFLPQPELAKSGGLGWFSKGFSYVAGSFPWWVWLVFLALLALGVRWSIANRSLAGCMAGSTFVLAVLLLCFSRGDWMGGARLLVPYLAPGLVVMVIGAWSLRSVGRRLAVSILVAIECVTVVLFANGAAWLSPQSFVVSSTAQGSSPADYGSFLGASWQTQIAHPPPLPWYVDWSSATTRDAFFLALATPKLRALIRQEPPGRKITIASTQAGMIFYTWANEFPGKLRFIDTESIVTNVFSRCHNAYASYSGDLMSIEAWADDARKCAPPLPDLYVSTFSTPGQGHYFRVISKLLIEYNRRGIGVTRPWLGYEFLEQRRSWHP